MAKLDRNKYKGRTSNMLIDPFFQGDLFIEYPFLADAPSGSIGELRLQDAIRACAFILDPYSPLVREYTDLNNRRDMVVGMMPPFGTPSKKLEVWLLINVYRNNEWSILCTIDNVIREFTEKANEPLDDTGENALDPEKMLKAVALKRKYIDDLMAMTETRIGLYNKIFMNNEDLTKMHENSAMTPENYVKSKRNNA